ncbi:hypothetical protein L1887_14297 [Cichorium endivia]|nr:hypothetical protein L1887_14297 [Cichorium endivia]
MPPSFFLYGRHLPDLLPPPLHGLFPPSSLQLSASSTKSIFKRNTARVDKMVGGGWQCWQGHWRGGSNSGYGLKDGEGGFPIMHMIGIS